MTEHSSNHGLIQEAREIIKDFVAQSKLCEKITSYAPSVARAKEWLEKTDLQEEQSELEEHD